MTSHPPVVPAEQVARLARLVAPLGTVADVEQLTGGMFAIAYRVTLVDGRRVVVKTMPPTADGLLTYERDLLRTEAEVYGLAAQRPDLLMPQVLLTDFTRAVMPGDALVVEHLDGVPLTELGPADPTQEADHQHQVGAYMARLHTVTGTVFGYPNPAAGLAAPTWPEAFDLMVEAILRDAERWQVAVPVDAVRATVRRHRAALAEVDVPHLVHTDLWAGNLFVDPVTRRLCGVIDTERSVWGDPLLELAGADELSRGPVPDALVRGYLSGGGALALGTPAGEARLLLYRMYIALVLLVVVPARGFEGDWVEPYRATCAANLAAALDALHRPDALR